MKKTNQWEEKRQHSNVLTSKYGCAGLDSFIFNHHLKIFGLLYYFSSNNFIESGAESNC